jgi:tetratricopeptide (TPR) repeat protein
MGEVMVAHGLLSREDLKRASEIVILERRRLGEVLLSLGILQEDGVEEALALHAREVLLEIFSWNAGTYEFDEQPAEVFRGHDRPLRLSTGEVILDAVWSIRDRDVVRYALGDLDRVLLPSTDPLLRFQRITLTPTDGFILSRVDGTLSAREILTIAPAAAEEAERCLLGLLCTGMVEYASPLPKAREGPPESRREEILDLSRRLVGWDHFQVLGVATTASSAEIKAAYFRLVKRFHPDNRHDRALADLGDVLEAIFQRVNEAYRVLADLPDVNRTPAVERVAARPAAPAPVVPPTPPPPAPLPESAIGPTADDLMLRARERLEEGRHWEAVALLGEAIPLVSGARLSRARLMLAKAYLRSPERVKDAEKELRAVLDADPQLTDAALLLAKLYRDAGLVARAAALYQKVLEARPDDPEARAGLSANAPESGRSPGSALRRLFGRS